MKRRGSVGAAWAGLGCGSLLLWCVWTTISAAAPAPMLLVNLLVLGGLVAAVVLAPGRRIGAAVAGRLVPGGSPLVLLGLLMAVVGSGAGVAALLLVAPEPQAEVQVAAPDGSEVAEGGDGDSSEAAASPAPPSPEPAAPTPEPAALAEILADGVESDEDPRAPEQPPDDARVRPPNAEELRLDAEVWREEERHPEGDAFARVARRRGVPRERVVEASARAGVYRDHLAQDVRRVVARGVVGRVTSGMVIRSEHGAFTVAVTLVVTGCPPGKLPARFPGSPVDRGSPGPQRTRPRVSWAPSWRLPSQPRPLELIARSRWGRCQGTSRAGFGVRGSEFGVRGSGFGIRGSGFPVGLGLGARPRPR